MRNKVSVVIPCYNYSKYIEISLLSVLCQRCDYDIEILVSDDCSSDNTFNIINRIKNSYIGLPGFVIKCFLQPVNIGVINNTKFLLENCTGKYIAYLDADDFWTDPFKLSKQIDFMDNNPDYSLCITGFSKLEDGKYIPSDHFDSWFCPIDVNNLNSESLTNYNIVGSSSSRFFRNYSAQLIKDYFYEFPYSDWALNFELSLKGKISYLDFPSYVYRIHDGSLSSSESHKDDKEISDLFNKRCSILKSIYNELITY